MTEVEAIEIKSNGVRDITYVMKVRDKFTLKTDTPRISGLLTTVLIQSDKPYYNVWIRLKNMRTVLLLKVLNIDRPEVIIPLKVDYFNMNKGIYESPDFWVLNDELEIEVSGQKNTNIKVTLRVKDA